MTSFASLPQLWTALASTVKAVAPTRLMITKGAPIPPLTDREDWIQFDLLSDFGRSEHQDEKTSDVMFQVMCFSRYGSVRADKDAIYPYVMADAYANALRRKVLTVDSSCLRIFDPKQVYLDLRSTGEFSKQIYLNAVSTDTHCVVLLFDALLIETLK